MNMEGGRVITLSCPSLHSCPLDVGILSVLQDLFSFLLCQPPADEDDDDDEGPCSCPVESEPFRRGAN